MASPGFFEAMQPSIDAYNAGPPLQQGLIPGVVNTGMPQGAPPPIAAPPPPAADPMIGGASSPLDGGFSPAPPPPANLASTPAPAPGAPPAPPQAPRTVVMRGAGTPQHEVLTKGQTALAYENKAEQQRLEGVDEQTSAAQTAATNQMLSAAVQRDDAERRVQEAAALQVAQQKSLAEANDKVHSATEATKNVAPITDYWADRSTFQHIGSAIMIGLAGIGQAISGDHGENPAMKNLQNAMDMDLRTKQLRFQQQSAGLNAKKDEAQQHFDNMVKQFGMEPATQIMAAAQRDKVAAQVDMDAAATKNQMVIANGAKMSADLRADANERRAGAVKLIQASKAEDQYFDPELGVWTTRKELAAFREKKALENQQQSGRLDVESVKERAKANSPEKVQEGTKFIASEAQKAGLPGTLSALDAAAKEMKRGNTSGIGIAPTAVFEGGAIGRAIYAHHYGEEAAQREQSWRAVKSQIINGLSGATTSEKEDKTRLEPMLEGANTPEARQYVIEESRKAIARKMSNIKAGAGAAAANQYDADIRAMTPGAGANPTTGIVETPVK